MARILTDTRPVTVPKGATPVFTLKHPNTQSTVTLIGICHVGQEAYYQELRRKIFALQRSGALVHVEHVRTPTDAELAEAPPLDRELVKILTKALENGRKPFRWIGLAAQRDVWIRDPSWEVHDLSMLDAVQHYGEEAVRQKAIANATRKHVLRMMPPGKRRNLLLHQIIDPMLALRSNMSRDVLGAGRKMGFEVLREDLAMNEADRCLSQRPGSRLAMVWGSMHVMAFRAGFEERGYELIDESWVTFIDPATLTRPRRVW